MSRAHARAALAALVAVLSLPAVAAAQQTATAGGATNARWDRLDSEAAALEAATLPPKPGDRSWLNLAVPLYFNSNADNAPHDGARSFETDPDVALGLRRRLGALPLRLTAKFGTHDDEYADHPESDAQEATALLQLAYFDPADDQALSPYASVKERWEFTGFYDRFDQLQSNLVLGLEKTFAFDGAFRRLAPSPNSQAARVWWLGLEGSVQRRLRSEGPNSVALYGGLSLGYRPAPRYTVLLSTVAFERWFAAQDSSRRVDFKIEPILTLAYAPDWSGVALATLAGAPSLALQIGFVQRDSSRAEKSYTQWTVGPVLSARWDF